MVVNAGVKQTNKITLRSARRNAVENSLTGADTVRDVRLETGFAKSGAPLCVLHDKGPPKRQIADEGHR